MLGHHLKQSQSSPRGCTRPGLTMQASLRDREQHTLPPPGFQLAWGKRGKKSCLLLQISRFSNLDGILTGPIPITVSWPGKACQVPRTSFQQEVCSQTPPLL